MLAQAAQAYGAEIRLGAPVTVGEHRRRPRLGVGSRTAPVQRAGRGIGARPRRTFLELVEPRELPIDLVDDVPADAVPRGLGQVNFALDGLPTFPALPDTADHFGGFLNIGPTIEYVERAFDAAKYGWYSEQPFIDAAIQSVIDPDMAPPGKHVISCSCGTRRTSSAAATGRPSARHFGDRAQAVLESHFPGFGDLVLQRKVVTPLDIEARTGLTEGNIFAGEFLAPQMYFFRPAPGWSQYATPINGYYQCGSGTHPGGCVIGSPGRLASQQVLRDLTR